MPQPSAELMAAVFPGVHPRRRLVGRETMLSIGKARRLLDYRPEHSWQQHLTEP